MESFKDLVFDHVGGVGGAAGAVHIEERRLSDYGALLGLPAKKRSCWASEGGAGAVGQISGEGLVWQVGIGLWIGRLGPFAALLQLRRVPPVRMGEPCQPWRGIGPPLPNVS
ncbi:hypothetical protein [Actinoallomurus sp. NPDC050550]|uniref:hypothetical protein n=1 Tax=Actinoallomurus sp. NPDC050550 TaxID=3154937 RepID=UPI0033FF6C9A